MTFANSKFIGFLGGATVVIVAEYILILSDSVIAGRMLGEEALGAVNLLSPIFMMVSFFTWMLALGTSIIYSGAVARMQNERASNIAGQGLVASILLGLALCVAIPAVKGYYIDFMSPGAEIAGYALDYLKWYPLVALFEAVDLLLLYLIYADGGDVCCMVSYSMQVIVNIALSYGLCSGKWGLPMLGMGGIAIGTVAAYMVGMAILLLRLLFYGKCEIRFAPKFLPYDFVRSLKMSFGDASIGLFQALLFFVTTNYMIRVWGSDSLPITTVVFFVVRLSLFFNGVGIALQPIETVYHGEGNTIGIHRIVRFAACISVFEGLFLAAVVFIGPELLAEVVGIDDPELVRDASHAARLTVLGLVGYALTYMLNSHYQYIGRPGRSIMLTGLAFFAIPIVLLFAFGRIAGMDGVWLAISMGPTLAVSAFLAIPLMRPQKPSVTGPKILLWSVMASDSAKCAEIVALIDAALIRVVPPKATSQITDVLTLALKHIRERNGKRHVQAEITIKPEPNGTRLIVRDDGQHFAIDALDCPVMHRPVAGFNRNIFFIPSFDERFENRYEILHGIDMSADELNEVVALDDHSFDACYHTTPEYNRMLFKTNRESGFVVRDRETNTIVGYTMLLPVTDAAYKQIREGTLKDTELRPEMVMKYDSPGTYRLFFSSIVVHPMHRSPRMIFALMGAMVDDFIALAGRGVFVDRMVCDVVSRDGRKFCRLLGFEKICMSNHNSTIYEISGRPPRFRATTSSIRRLGVAYGVKL